MSWKCKMMPFSRTPVCRTNQRPRSVSLFATALLSIRMAVNHSNELREAGELHKEAHEGFIVGSDKNTDQFEFWVTEHLRASGYYWGYTALFVMGREWVIDRETAIGNIVRCFDEKTGGFGGNQGHDPHMLYTLSAVQVLFLFDALDRIDTAKVARFVSSKQLEDGSFAGDEWGEIDTRFSYIALNCLSLLGRLHDVDVEAAVRFVLSCQNFDGGFGVLPGAESHAGQTFCCVGALSIAGCLDRIDRDLLGWWLAERQLPEGGLNGRPQKLPDVCYSWWVLSSLSCLDRLGWIDRDKLVSWILDCQDPDLGGFADRPDDAPDIYHTFFGLAGLSLLGFPNLSPIDQIGRA